VLEKVITVNSLEIQGCQTKGLRVGRPTGLAQQAACSLEVVALAHTAWEQGPLVLLAMNFGDNVGVALRCPMACQVSPLLQRNRMQK